MTNDEAINAAVAKRDDIARELKRANGKISKRAKELTDDSARLLSTAMRGGYGMAMIKALQTRPLPVDVLPEAAE